VFLKTLFSVEVSILFLGNLSDVSWNDFWK
jgi:hypothetical protein